MNERYTWTLGLVNTAITRVSCLCCLLLAGLDVAPADVRTWTDVKGRTVDGNLLSVSKDSVKVRLKSGKLVNIPLSRLSEKDRKFVGNWKGKGANRPRAKWPNEIYIGRETEVSLVKEDHPASEYVYRTAHFEFHSDTKIAKSLIKDFSMAFEAVYKALKALPLNMDPKPPNGYFQARLFGDRRGFMEAGGPPSAGGVYLPSKNVILVPLTSLGVKRVGSSWRKDNKVYDNSTLRHEITHQVMHEWIDHLPVWMVEGFAEYIGSMTYLNGRFRLNPSARKNSMRAEFDKFEKYCADRGKMVKTTKMDKLLEINLREWNMENARGNGYLNYASSLLLVYYFFHLDGKGDGARMISYLREIADSKASVEDYLKKYKAALVKANQKADKNKGVRTDYPSILLTPARDVVFKTGSRHQKAFDLLMDSRGAKKLEAELKEKYEVLGIRFP